MEELTSAKQKLFIKRERVRRALIKTKPGETICLNFEQVDILLTWMKELEKAKEGVCENWECGRRNVKLPKRV